MVYQHSLPQHTIFCMHSDLDDLVHPAWLFSTAVLLELTSNLTRAAKGDPSYTTFMVIVQCNY